MDERPEFAAPPIDPAGFCTLWRRFGEPRRLVLAVSGGSDSMALMRLAAPLRADGLAEISVATVDHGLRPEARLEAEMVGREADALGLDHAILIWAGDKPSTGLQAAARTARYRLLVAHAETRSAEAIMTAHTAEDQAETVFMRLQRGSGPRGLAGMAEETLVAAGASDPIRLLRPLLSFRRQGLRDYLQKAGAPFVDDPSNENTAFERVRIRRLLQTLEAEGALTVEALVQSAAASRALARRMEAAENARFAELAGAFDAFGGASVNLSSLAVEDLPILARLIHAVGGGDHPPTQMTTADAWAKALAGRTATLGGAALGVGEDRLRIWREPAAVLGRAGVAPLALVDLAPGERILWDRRFIIVNPSGAEARLEPLGNAAPAFAASTREAEMLAAAPRLILGGGETIIAGESPFFRPLAEERFFLRVNRFH